MLALLRYTSICDGKMQKKFKNRRWKSRACVPLIKGIPNVINTWIQFFSVEYIFCKPKKYFFLKFWKSCNKINKMIIATEGAVFRFQDWYITTVI